MSESHFPNAFTENKSAYCSLSFCHLTVCFCWHDHVFHILFPSSTMDQRFQGALKSKKPSAGRASEASERSERRGRNLWSPWTKTSFSSLSDCMSHCFVKTSVARQFNYNSVSCAVSRKHVSKDK